MNRADWKGELEKLEDNEETEQLKKWLRMMWPQKGAWEEMARRKRDQIQHEAALRKHERTVTDTKRKRK